MKSTDSSIGGGGKPQQPNLPPGFRFHPTDEELLVHYLKKKATSVPLPVPIIADVDLYKFDPWELPAKAAFGEQEWYFFSPRERKYPNGTRPNRAARSGYWKATGTDKPILTSGGTQKVGVKKALVFYGGKPPKGIKTDWIMHEYRLVDNKLSNKPPICILGNKKNSLRLDDWVLCRIYKKSSSHRPMDHDKDDQQMEDFTMNGSIPPSISIGRQDLDARIQFSKGYGGGLQLESENQSLFEGIINNNVNVNINGTNSIDHQLASSSVSKPLEPPVLPMKRNLPSLYNWTEDAGSGSFSGKRLFPGDHGTNVDVGHDINGSSNSSYIATLFGQLPPQTPPLHQQAMLGSLGDGIFRQQQTYQLPGMNWYS